MRSKLAPGERPLHWIGSAKKDFLAMPMQVQRGSGMALGVAQHGGKHPSVKPWKGEGPGVMEIVTNFDGDTFRAIYTLKFRKAIYVLHCFQKKSPHGIKTANVDVDLVRRRLQAARIDHEALYGKTNS